MTNKSDDTNYPDEFLKLKEEYAAFAYIVAHDLSSPFRQIEGFSNIILKKYADDLNDDAKKCFDFIIKSSQHGSNVVDGLLTYSRINTHAKPFTDVDLDSLFKDVEFKLSEEIRSSDAKIEVKNLPTLNGDKDQLALLLYHITKNALIFSKKETKPLVSITATKQGNQWQFRFKDNGIGVPDANRNNVFDPLKRAVAEKEYPGVGMGLAISKKIIERHGGKAWIESHEGQGSEFYFTLSSE